MQDRELKIVNMEKIEEQIANGEVSDFDGDPQEALYETLLDLLQVAKAEGLSDEEIDAVMRRVNDYRADRNRDQFRLHT